MDKQITSNATAGRRPAILISNRSFRQWGVPWRGQTEVRVNSSSGAGILTIPFLCTLRRILLLLIVFPAVLPVSKAETLAAKNKEGNQLFAQGKYEDAEKAYLEAQGKNPGKPEILYNLGNSLIKQKKYDQGVQSLRQSMNNGDKGIKASSWYNAGNALFSASKFKESAEAYIQALRLDPSDREAKHNLELALLKMKQQESQPKDESSKQNKGASGKNSSGANKEDKQQANTNKSNNSGTPKEQKESMKSPASPNELREGSISREQALQMLDALKNRELEDQRKLLERQAAKPTNKKDW
jgi:Ca-activated chloride channel homolog